MYSPSKSILFFISFTVLWIPFSQAQPGLTCESAGDISDQVITNDPIGHQLTIDTRFSDQFISFTAPVAGTLQFDQGYNGITYLVIYGDQCQLLDEKLLWYSYDVFTIELGAGETIVLECDRRNNVSGKEVLQATIHFQERVVGEKPAEAIPLVEGTNQVTRYLGNQYFKYETHQTGLLTIKTCHDGNPVDGTYLKLYENDSLTNLIQDNVWCSNDPDGDLTQSTITYEVTEIGMELVLEVKQVPFWFESYDLSLAFMSNAGKTCEVPIEVIAGGTYEIDHAPDDAPYQEDFWYTFKADEAGTLTLSNCEQTEAITKVTAFESCGGTRLWVADGNCNGGAELVISLAAEDEIVFRWDDHNEPDWNIEDYAYSFEVQFETLPVEDGVSCETAYLISGYGTYDVDNSGGDQWFQFTAHETTKIAITTGSNAAGWGETSLARNQDTKFKVYDVCGGTILVQNDDSPIVKWRRSYATLEVVEGMKYLIQWEDQFVTTPHQYQFEIFKVDDYLSHASVNEPESINVGIHRAFLNYKNQHWFKYTFPSDGVLVAVNLDGQVGRVIPSYQMFYGDNGLDLELPDQDEFAIQNWSNDEPTETNFMYQGIAGEEVLLRVEEVAGIHFYSVGNRDFELAFFANNQYEDLCYVQSDLTEGVHQIDALLGDQKYKFIAPEAGLYSFTAEDNPSMLIRIYDGCFGDALYTKYNDFHFEKQMAEGEEIFLVFFDEYGGKVRFEISREEPCEDEVITTVEACDEYSFDGYTLTSSGMYEATFTNEAGCDSLVHLTLTILESTSSETIAEACESYDWNEVTYTSTGVYEVVLENVAGCDSTAVLDLTILESTSSETIVKACESYDWNEVTYTSTGVYEVILENAAGCDSTAVLDLTILESTSSEMIVEACESYDWNEVTYTSTGVYEVVLENAAGCDSTALLDLTILESTSSETIVEACESYDWNEVTYTSTGLYEVVLENAAGCDSTAVLDLTILESTSSETIVEACESYDWNEVTYTSTGVYEVVLENAAGCDSTAVLDLTILETASSVTYVEAYERYAWNGETYEVSGLYEVTLTNDSGCDSLAQLELTILDRLSQTITLNDMPELKYGQGDITLEAEASSALEVSYQISNKAVASMEGTSLQIHAAGDFSITVSQEGNEKYLPAEEVTLQLTVDKAKLIVSVNDQNKVYGAENPTFTYFYQGFVHDDDESDLHSIPMVTTLATATTDVGSYVINVSGGASDNYEFVYVDGTLEIEQTDQFIDFEIPTNWIYGDTEFDLLAEASSGLSVTYVSSDEQVAVINDSKVEIVGAGVSTITAIQKGDQNFRETESTQRLVVDKAPLKIIANDQEMHLRQQVPDLTMRIEGLVNDETMDDLEVLPNIWTQVTAESEMGQYGIFLEGGEDKNYAFDLVNGTLTVDAALSTRARSEHVHIYPNPSADRLNIELPETNSGWPTEVIIQDLMGRVHYNAAVTDPHIEIDITSFPTGILILQVKMKSSSLVETIIKR